MTGATNSNYTETTQIVVNEIPGLPIEADTALKMNSQTTAENVGKLFRYTGTTGTFRNNSIYICIED